jgi:S1-C subfamily serine protease
VNYFPFHLGDYAAHTAQLEPLEPRMPLPSPQPLSAASPAVCRAEPGAAGGLKVTKVGRKSPAEAAGIKEGDVLFKMNGVALKDRGQMQDLLEEMSAGNEVTLETERGGKPKTFSLALGER